MTIYAQTTSGTLAAEKLSQTPEYHRPHQRVKRPQEIFPGRRDRRPAPPTASRGSITTGLSLLLLLLGLQGCNLPPRHRGLAVACATRWAEEIVETRHQGGAA